MLSSNTIIAKIISDKSFWVLLLSNIVVIYMAVTQSWDMTSVAWTYFFQSIVIGYFNLKRIDALENFTVTSLTQNQEGKRLFLNTSPEITKLSCKLFFMIQYGIFHAVIFSMLALREKELPHTEINFVLLSAFIFYLNHLFSFKYNQRRDNHRVDIMKVVFYPYYRIVPMFIVLVAAGSFETLGASDLFPFLFIKTITDLGAHIYEHKFLYAKKEPLVLS